MPQEEAPNTTVANACEEGYEENHSEVSTQHDSAQFGPLCLPVTRTVLYDEKKERTDMIGL